MFLPCRDWMDAQPGLISSVVYTYLSLIPSHVSPSLANLKEQESQMCVSLIRTRVRLTLSACTSLVPRPLRGRPGDEARTSHIHNYCVR